MKFYYYLILMKTKHHPYKNNCSSSSFLKFRFLNCINEKMNPEHKNGKEKQSNLTPNKRFSESVKRKNESLLQFMENQNKKHLSTKFAYRDVLNFLNEKDKAMEQIIIDENIIRNTDSTKDDDHRTKLNTTDPDTNKQQNDNRTSHLLIFHGTFGEDKYGQIMKEKEKEKEKEKHHHHNHHHHHHHHHHCHSSENIILANKINNNENFDINKN